MISACFWITSASSINVSITNLSLWSIVDVDLVDLLSSNCSAMKLISSFRHITISTSQYYCKG